MQSLGSSEPPSASVALRRPRESALARLDLKTLRLSTHGWRLGATLVYKPGVRDLTTVARELASAGLPSGALLLDDTAEGGPATRAAQASHPASVRMALIVREQASRAELGMAASCAAAEVIEGALGRQCAIAWPWDVGLRTGGALSRVCRVAVEMDPEQGVAYVGLRFALARLWNAHRAMRAASDMPGSTLFTHDHWREMMLARTLHALDVRLSALTASHEAERRTARVTLTQDWRRRVIAPQRVVVAGCDSSRFTGLGAQIASDGALLVRQTPLAPRRFALDAVALAWGVGWDSPWPGALAQPEQGRSDPHEYIQ
ncbi:MAG TPA: hypothetical protein VF739_13535 [Ktedonobacterales bacterium]